MVTSPDFMKSFGVYTSFSESWLARWIGEVLENGCLAMDQLKELGRIGAETYCQSLRSSEAKEIIINIFCKDFQLDSESVEVNGAGVPEMPITLTWHNCQLLSSLIEAYRIEQPVLIEGTAGSFKTCLARLSSFLLGIPYEQLCLTADSEPSDMIGELLPVSNPAAQKPVEWCDGPLTRAFKKGSMFIGDNIGQTKPTLQERINPIGESPKVLVLTEKDVFLRDCLDERTVLEHETGTAVGDAYTRLAYARPLTTGKSNA